MNCKTLEKAFGYKSMSSFNQARPEQLYCCFNKDPSKSLHSIKFVPKEGPLRVPAEKYYESNSQALIYNRMVNLHKNYKMEGGESRILSQTLRDLMNSGQRSFMNLSTDMEAKSHKNMRRSASFSSNKQHFYSHPLKNSPNKTMSLTQKYSNNQSFDRNISMPRRNYTSLNERDLDEVKLERNTHENEESTPHSVETGSISPDWLEESSLKIKDNLMRVDDKLKERLNVMKNKNRPSDLPHDTYSEDFTVTPRYPHDLGLMPIRRERSPLIQFIEDSKRLRAGRREAEELLAPETQSMSQFLSEIVPDSATNFFKVRPDFSSLRKINPRDHIIQITTKHAADADGIYYAPRHVI